MTDGISRRDFLNGVALTIAAGLTPAAQLAAQIVPLPARTHRTARTSSGIVRDAHAFREGKTFRASTGCRSGALRSRRRRWRHQRSGGRLVLSPARRTERPHPRPRQSRRLRRPRQAQRVSPRWPADHRLWRQRVAAIAEVRVQPDCQATDQGPRHRCRSLRDRIQAQLLSVARPVPRRVLRPRDLRPRHAGDRRSDDDGRRRPHVRPAQCQVDARLRRRFSHFRQGQVGTARAVRAEGRSARRQDASSRRSRP